ncbi:MAG: hypothetical protein AAB575_00450 [Patescibacteria group bacterium]
MNNNWHNYPYMISTDAKLGGFRFVRKSSSVGLVRGIIQKIVSKYLR